MKSNYKADNKGILIIYNTCTLRHIDFPKEAWDTWKEDIDQISEQNKHTKLSLNYEKRKVKRDQFKKAIEDRRTKRLEELGYSDKDNFDEFASKTLMNEVLNTVVNLIESKEIESG